MRGKPIHPPASSSGAGAAPVIGLDVGGTKTALLIRQGTETVLETTVPSSRELGVLAALIDEAITRAGLRPGHIGGLAIGVPGRVNPDAGLVIDAPALGWLNTDLQGELFSRYPFPCRLENDTAMALMAECSEGRAVGLPDVVFLAIGTGLGSALLCGGQPVLGADFCAGEIGYWLLDGDAVREDGTGDGCFGSLESRLSGSGLARMAAPLNHTPESLLAQYDQLDESEREVVGLFLHRLSVTIANLVSLLNPRMVVLGGGVSRSLSPFLDTLRTNVRRFTPLRSELMLSAFLERAGVIGACVCARRLSDHHPFRRGTAAERPPADPTLTWCHDPQDAAAN